MSMNSAQKKAWRKVKRNARQAKDGMSKDPCQRAREFKRRTVHAKGGACVVCGYSRCMAALDFHHVRPATKSFAISTAHATRTWAEVLPELDKCVLLCATCHREVHAGHHTEYLHT